MNRVVRLLMFTRYSKFYPQLRLLQKEYMQVFNDIYYLWYYSSQYLNFVNYLVRHKIRSILPDSLTIHKDFKTPHFSVKHFIQMER